MVFLKGMMEFYKSTLTYAKALDVSEEDWLELPYWYFWAGVTSNKSITIQIASYRQTTEYWAGYWYYKDKTHDHAGLSINLRLFGWDLRFDFIDNRHADKR